MSYLTLTPIRLRPAKRYVAEHHSHNKIPTAGWLFGTSVFANGELVGVGIAGRPNAKELDTGVAVEVTRVATCGTPNACSRLYAALCRAAAALGYVDAWTYTLASECAACVRAAGFQRDAELPARDGWDTLARPRVNVDLFGEHRTPPGAKVRWHRRLAS